MQQVNLKRRALHHSLRQHQLQQHFSKKRALLTLPPPQQAKEQLIGALSCIRQQIEKGHAFENIDLLLVYRSIAQKYNISPILLSELLFSFELPVVQNGLLPVETTWTEIFLFMAETEGKSPFQEELLKILTINTYQLRISLGNHQNKVVPLLKETISKIPFEWCLNRDLWTDICLFFGEVLIAAAMMAVEDICLSQQFGIFQCLEIMSHETFFCEQIEARQIFIEVSLLTLTLIFDGEIHKENNKSFRDSLGELIMNNFERFDDIDRNCEYLRRYLTIQGVLSHDDLQYFQESLPLALEKRCSQYFEICYALLRLHQLSLSEKSFSTLADFLLDSISLDQDGTKILEIKKWIFLILTRHFQTSSGEKTEEEISHLLKVCLENNHILKKLLFQLQQLDLGIHRLAVDLLTQIFLPFSDAHLLPDELLEVLGQLHPFYGEQKKTQNRPDEL